jgi:hypothetical protein
MRYSIVSYVERNTLAYFGIEIFLVLSERVSRFRDSRLEDVSIRAVRMV